MTMNPSPAEPETLGIQPSGAGKRMTNASSIIQAAKRLKFQQRGEAWTMTLLPHPIQTHRTSCILVA
jgi:hypothetical protein